jgi:hypothetical protein
MRSTEELRLHSARIGLISPPDVQRRLNDTSLSPRSRSRGCDVRDFAYLRILRTRCSLSSCCKCCCIGSAKPGARSFAHRLRRFAHPPPVAGVPTATTVTIGEIVPGAGTSANLAFALNAASDSQTISRAAIGLPAVARWLAYDRNWPGDESDRVLGRREGDLQKTTHAGGLRW